MAAIDLRTDVALPTNTTIDVTVREDDNADGTFENEATQTINSGQRVYQLTGFTDNASSEWDIVLDYGSSRVAEAASVREIRILSAATEAMTLKTDAVIPANTTLSARVRETMAGVTNEKSQTITDGTRQYELTGFYDATDSDWDITLDYGTTAIDTAATVNSVQLTSGSPPLAPTLSTSVTEDTISLSWTASDAENGYRIYRGQTTGSLAQIDSVAADTTTYDDTGLLDGEEYYYQVEAYNASGTSTSNESSQVTALPAPTTLVADTVGATSIDVSWTPTHDNGFTRVEVKPSSESSWTNDSGELSRTTSSYSLTGLRHGEEYDIRVIAYTAHALTIDQ